MVSACFPADWPSPARSNSSPGKDWTGNTHNYRKMSKCYLKRPRTMNTPSRFASDGCRTILIVYMFIINCIILILNSYIAPREMCVNNCLILLQCSFVCARMCHLSSWLPTTTSFSSTMLGCLSLSSRVISLRLLMGIPNRERAGRRPHWNNHRNKKKTLNELGDGLWTTWESK